MAAKRPKVTARFWLFKSEPDVFSFDDLLSRPNSVERWDGVRNYQARNLLRDEIKVGDLVLFYHSNAKPPHVAGVARVVSAPYADPLAVDPSSPYFDARIGDKPNPWVALDVEGVIALPAIVPLAELKANDKLAQMKVVAKGSRLSVQPVTQAEFEEVLAMGELSLEALERACANLQ